MRRDSNAGDRKLDGCVREKRPVIYRLESRPERAPHAESEA